MKKLDAYKQAKADYEFAQETVNKLSEVLDFYKTVTVNSNITINSSSSDKQFVYAISILNNQISACKELDIDSTEYEESRATVLQIRTTSKELKAWQEYAGDLAFYVRCVRDLLDKDELFELLEVPVKP